MPDLPESARESQSEADFWSEQWTNLLAMTAEAIQAADAVMAAMRGDLGPAFKGKTSHEAAPEIHRRVERWSDARNRIVGYARHAQDELATVADA